MSYQDRMQTMGLADPQDIRKSLTDVNAVLLDVRTMAEIEAAGKFEKEGHKWVQSDCGAASRDFDNTALEAVADKRAPIVIYNGFESCIIEIPALEAVADKRAPIVIYCRSGRRASRAKEILESKGYSNVLNAGGYDDLNSMGL